MTYNHYLPDPLGDIRWTLRAALRHGDDDEFARQFTHQLHFVGHPQQEFPLDSSMEWYDPEETSHLDQVWQWFVLGLLIDPEFGCLQLAENDAEHRSVLQAALWLYGHVDAASEPPPNPGLVPEDWLPIYDEVSVTKVARLAVALFDAENNKDCGEFLVKCAAQCFDDHPLSLRKAFLARRERMAMRIFNGALFLAGQYTPLLDSEPDGLRAHYYRQAEWMLDLILLEWKPHDEEEQAHFDRLLAGEDFDLEAYEFLLRDRWVEPELFERMPATAAHIRRLHAIARDLRSEAEKW